MTLAPALPVITCFYQPASPGCFIWKPRDVNAYAADEEGLTLAEHYCSGPHWAESDIQGEWHHPAYDARYPQGWKLAWIGGAAPPNWQGPKVIAAHPAVARVIEPLALPAPRP